MILTARGPVPADKVSGDKLTTTTVTAKRLVKVFGIFGVVPTATVKMMSKRSD